MDTDFLCVPIKPYNKVYVFNYKNNVADRPSKILPTKTMTKVKADILHLECTLLILTPTDCTL